jgi:hypothetical protein
VIRVQKNADVRVEKNSELKALLKSLRLWDDFHFGRLRCKFCNRLLTGDNLASVFTYKGSAFAGCTDYNCYKFFLSLCIINELAKRGNPL